MNCTNMDNSGYLISLPSKAFMVLHLKSRCGSWIGSFTKSQNLSAAAFCLILTSERCEERGHSCCLIIWQAFSLKHIVAFTHCMSKMTLSELLDCHVSVNCMAIAHWVSWRCRLPTRGIPYLFPTLISGLQLRSHPVIYPVYSESCIRCCLSSLSRKWEKSFSMQHWHADGELDSQHALHIIYFHRSYLSMIWCSVA